ncbi:MAG: ESX secretion-associated protein EspG [Mycobacteriaceae bacterium]|nr:ESX secretion-associated protein EspG [Mycobacteriaceae bacterium]
MTAITGDSLLAVAGILGVQTFPAALAVAPKYDHIDAWRIAHDETMSELSAGGILDQYGDVADELAAALRILARPDRQLAVRIYAPDGVRRVCLARRGLDHALAVRTGDDFDVRLVWGGDDHAALARPILAALGAAEAADVPVFGAESAELRERLDEARGTAEFSDLAFHFGAAERDAVAFGMAMASCHTRAEITAYHHDNAVAVRAPAAVAVYDTARGRVVAGPTRTADHRTWSTFAPGTDHRLTQGISALIGALPGERWMP